MGIHKYGPDTCSSHLCIKSLGKRVPRADGHGSTSCNVVCCMFWALTCWVICVVVCMNNIHGRLCMETLGLENITLVVRKTK